MAAIFYHVESVTPLDAGSTEIPRKGAKIEVPVSGSGNFAVVALDKRFWSIRNTGKTQVGDTNADVFYRVGADAPETGYGVDTAAKRASVPIESGADEVVQVDAAAGKIQAVALVGSGAAVVVAIRPNDASYK